MKKIVRLTENDLTKLVKTMINEMEEKKELPSNYKELYNSMPTSLKELMFRQWDAKQNPKWHPEGNSLKHILVVIKRAYHHYPNDPNMIMAALFHDLGKMDTYGINPKTGEPTAYGHEDKSEKYVEEYRDWIESFGGTDVDEIKYIVKNHMKIKPSTWDVMKDSKKEPISSHSAFEKLRGFTDKLDGGGTMMEQSIRRNLRRLVNESNDFDVDDIVNELDDWIEGNVDYISQYSLEDKVQRLLNMDEEITSDVEELESDEGDEYGEDWGIKIIVIKYNGEDLMKVCVTPEGRYHYGNNRNMFNNRFYFDKSLL
jgi:hypothetical protein